MKRSLSSVALVGLLVPGLTGATTSNQPAMALAEAPVVSTAADGGLRPALGVHNLQVVRAHRTPPTQADALGDTYLHAPMLAYWHGRFHLDYLSAQVNEHDAPTTTSYTTSVDGVTWEAPRQLFPAVQLKDGAWTVMHQRTSFYIAPGDRLLATGYHGKAPSPNDGSGLGRVVREIKADGSFGPVYFIRLSAHNGWTPANAPLPMYSTSPDAGFVAACEALLADKRYTSQWWEEDKSEDGFYDLTLKAVSTLRRPDGSLLAVAKDAQHAVSNDGGRTWVRHGFVPNLPVNSSKYWLTPTGDGRFALVFNPTTRLRHPLAVATSTDAFTFTGLLAVHGELPVQRFPGKYKNLGPQYVRGILDGNGQPPGGNLWLTYSVNKEDIWVARVPGSIRGSAEPGPVNDGFDAVAADSLPDNWNIYSPLWAPVRVIATDTAAGRVLELRDEDPADYARAIRVFPATRGLKLSLKVYAHQTTGRLEIELATATGARPLRLAFTEDGRIEANHEGIWTDGGPYRANEWITLSLTLPSNPKADRTDLFVNGQKTLPRELVLAEPFTTVERLSIRTGVYRDRTEGGHEFPGADSKVPLSRFWIDDVQIAPEP